MKSDEKQEDRQFDMEEEEVRNLRFVGICCIIAGCFVVIATLLAIYFLHWTCITELIPAMLPFAFGIHCMKQCRKVKEYLEVSIPESGQESPFYYELEPCPQQRPLPPIPKDIRNHNYAVIHDKV